PVQFLFLAEVLRADRLVEGSGEDLVVEIRRQAAPGIIRTLGLARRLGIDLLVFRILVRGCVRGLGLARLLLFARSVGLLGLGIFGARILFAALLGALVSLRL